jgi:hypothetical protein
MMEKPSNTGTFFDGLVDEPRTPNQPCLQEEDGRNKLAGLYGLVPKAAGISDAATVKTKRAVALPRLQLETHAERAALRRLKPAWGDRTEQKEFRELVLARLAMIADARIMKGKRDLAKPTKSEVTKQLRRRAESVRRWASILEKPVHTFGLLPISLAPPIRDLWLCADRMDYCADYLQTSGNSLVAPPSGVARASKCPPRRQKMAETEQTMKLVEFVRQRTGEEHWGELVILLQRATNDLGYTKHRLQSLCNFHWQRRKAARRSLLVLFRPFHSRS